MELEQMLSELKSARAMELDCKNAMQAAMDEFTSADNAYTQNKKAREQATALVVELENQIREHGMEVYSVTGEKNIHEKVKAKIFKTLTVADPARVLSWVKTNLADALTFDKKKVENYASKIGPVDGIETGEEVRIQIASEL